MDFVEISKNLTQLWEHKPGAVILLIIGFLVFLFLVVDAWRHKRRHNRGRHNRRS